MDDMQERFWKLSMPETYRRSTHVKSKNIRFAHYTSAENGFKILETGKMLLRNSSVMNDFSEVQHGMNCLSKAYNGTMGDRLKNVLRQVQTGLPEILEKNFDNDVIGIRTETYLVSISEHGDPNTGLGPEDLFGRLSMWRAYAKQNGVAFVFNNTPFLSESNALNAFTSPVLYATPDAFESHFEELVLNFENNLDELIDLGSQFVHDLVMAAFRMTAQSTKHPAFEEEREWRVLYSPTLLHKNEQLTSTQFERIPTDLMTLGGVPQRVFSIPFQNHPDDGFVGATIPELLDRVLIGPSLDALAIQKAFISRLYESNVPDPESKVLITNIPLRT